MGRDIYDWTRQDETRQNWMRIGFRGVLLFIFLDLASLSYGARQQPTSRHKLQVHKHLKRLNKPPVKIKTIRMRPNYHPYGIYDENKMNTKSNERVDNIQRLWHANGMRPEDTIPIRRTKEDDVPRASSVKRYEKKKHKKIVVPRNIPR